MHRNETKPKGMLAVNERLLFARIDADLLTNEGRMIARAAAVHQDCGLAAHQCEDCAFLRVVSP